jgi:hypothetical protein
LASPAVTLAVVLAAALGLAFVPRSKTEPLRAGWREALRPGQQVLTSLADWASERWSSNRGGSTNSAEPEKQIAQLNEQVQRLQMALLVTGSKRDSASASGAASEENAVDGQIGRRTLPPLLLSQSIPARGRTRRTSGGNAPAAASGSRRSDRPSVLRQSSRP